MDACEALKHLGADVLKGIEWPFKHLALLGALLNDTLKDEPEVRTVILGLVQKVESVSPDFLSAVASSGTNVAADLKSLADVKVVFDYFRLTFVPVIEKAYADLKKDIQAPGAAAAESVPAPAAVLTLGEGLSIGVPAVATSEAVSVGGGLHTVTPL